MQINKWLVPFAFFVLSWFMGGFLFALIFQPSLGDWGTGIAGYLFSSALAFTVFVLLYKFIPQAKPPNA